MAMVTIYVLSSFLFASLWACVGLWRSLNRAEAKHAAYREWAENKIADLMAENVAAETAVLRDDAVLRIYLSKQA